MIEDPKEIATESALKLLFSLVYGKGSKESSVANELYEMFRQYLKNNKSDEPCIYEDKKDKEKILKTLAKSKKDLKELTTGLYVKFMCEYGCALIISKQKIESSISVEIILPEEWSSSSNSCKASKLQYCEPKGESSVYTPQLAEYQSNLCTFIRKFQGNLQEAIGYI